MGSCKLVEEYADLSNPEVVRGQPSLLDHEGIREAEWYTYRGRSDDPTGIRLGLAYLRHCPSDKLGARVVSLLAEGAVLSTAYANELLPRVMEYHDSPLCRMDLEGLVRVAPVVGAGRLDIGGRRSTWRTERETDPSWQFAREKKLPRPARWLAERVDLADMLIWDIVFFGTADLADMDDDLKAIGDDMVKWRAAIRSTDGQ